jgi:HAD superfamily hydrolase (TIGR01484 family)
MKTKEKVLANLKELKVIYSDVDGTFVTDGCLFRNKKGYSLKKAQAIYYLLTAGVDIVMTSGREKEKLKETARLLGFQNYIANLGIEIVYNRGEKVIHNYGMNVVDGENLKNLILETGVAQFLFDNFPGKIRFYKPWSDILRTHLLFIGELEYDQATALIYKYFPQLRIIDNGSVPPYQQFLHPHAYHVVPKEVGKKAAVQIDKKERKLNNDNLIAIGDSLEDLSLAEEVAIFFLLDKKIPVKYSNVIRLDNSDGEGFSRMAHSLRKAKII